MCGITLFISKEENDNNAVNNVLMSLFQLQNRGYDSFGIAYYDNSHNNYKIHKKSNSWVLGQEKDLYKIFEKETKNLQSNICIGHSRWATHGKISDINSHPHISNNNLFMCVHNGIIENYYEIKQSLKEHNYKFYSETDTEVIINLIEYYYKKCETIENISEKIEHSIYSAIQKLSGTYGLIILNNIIPENIYLIKNGSPLLIAENETLISATSELCGFNNQVKNYMELENKSLVVLSRNSGIKFFGEKSKQHNISNELSDHYLTQELGIYNHYTQKEILEQDKTLLLTLNNGARILNYNINLGGLQYLKPILSEISHIVFLGCGSSYYAGQIGVQYIKEIIQNHREIMGNLNVWCYDGGEFEEKDIPNGGLCLFVFISQSGETMDLIKHLPFLKSKSHKTMGIVNVIDSTLAREVDGGIYMNVGREVAVASTKSFNSSLLLLKLFSLWILQENNKTRQTNQSINIKVNETLKHQILEINNLIYQVKKLNQNINLIYDNLNLDGLDYEHIFVLGKGKSEYLAKECALKLKEICYIHGEGYSGTSLKHGPLALIQTGFPVILIITMENYEKMMNVYKEVQSRGAYIIIFSCVNKVFLDKLINDNNTKIIQLSQNSYISEINIMVALQHLCYNLSCYRGINPDKPKNLAKVVTVE